MQHLFSRHRIDKEPDSKETNRRQIIHLIEHTNELIASIEDALSKRPEHLATVTELLKRATHPEDIQLAKEALSIFHADWDVEKRKLALYQRKLVREQALLYQLDNE